MGRGYIASISETLHVAEVSYKNRYGMEIAADLYCSNTMTVGKNILR